MKKDEIKELTDAFIAKTQEMEYPKKNPEDPFRQYWNGVSDAVEVMLEALKEMTDKMKSEWKVRKIAYRVGPEGYQVYRLMDKEEPELPSNVEFLWTDYATREEAEAMAKKLNAEESRE